jgi:hypothetical protein
MVTAGMASACHDRRRRSSAAWRKNRAPTASDSIRRRAPAIPHAEITNVNGNRLRLSINAIRHRDGSVSGEVQEHVVTPTGEFVRQGHGTVVCFAVNGNIARIGAVVDHSSGAAAPGTEVIWTVVDNGEGANDPPDLASVAATSVLPDLAQRHCTKHPGAALGTLGLEGE